MSSLLDQRVFAPKEVAAFLDVKVDSVLDWIAAGELPASDCSRPGSRKPRWKILEDDLDAFLQRRKKVPTPKPRRRRRRVKNIIEFYE